MNNKYPVEDLEKRIGYSFKDKGLLLTALTHSSFKNEINSDGRDDYERLEFLGDAILEFAVSEYLYRNYPEMREGDMTSLRASLVCEMSLAGCAGQIGLSDFIFLGKGEDKQGSRYKPSIASDIFEALIGAIFLDSGIDEAKDFVSGFVLDDIEHKALFHDSKTLLQNLVQSEGWKLEYRLVKEEGPEHRKVFTVEAFVNGNSVSGGTGTSKKAAEQQAAYGALKKLRKDQCI